MSTLLDRLPAPLLTSAADDSEQLALPLVWEIAPGVPAVPPLPSHLRLVGSDQPPSRIPTGPAMTAAGPSVPPPMWVARMARAIAEVASGDRPPQQLTRWVEKRQLAMLAARGKAAQRHPSAIHGRNARAAMRSLQQVRAIRVCPVAPGVAETSAVLVGEGRGRAVAMRFEAVNDAWQVTAIALG
ncbi:MAG: Rv3235 family protein [Candidatus Nanopelagicales bacterium]